MMSMFPEYFCTAGRGTEEFLFDEIQEKLRGNIISSSKQDGKIHFSTLEFASIVEHIKCAERIFLKVKGIDRILLKKKKDFTKLRQALNRVSSERWYSHLRIWERHGRHEEPAPPTRKVRRFDIPAASQSPSSSQSSSHHSENGNDMDVVFSDWSDDDDSRSSGPDRYEDEDEDAPFPLPRPDSPPYMHGTFGGAGGASGPRRKRKRDDSGEPLKKKVTKDKDPSVKNKFTFRVNCKVSGEVSKLFKPEFVAKEIATMIGKITRWRAKLRGPQLEIYAQLNDGGILLGFPLSLSPLSERPYLKTFGMRSTVAWIIGKLAHIKPGDQVLDPMCGAATILVEACHSWPAAVYTGSDKDPKQLSKAVANVGHTKASSCIDLLQADVTALPQKSSSVDVILCDTPFGINHGDVDEVKSLYPAMLAEMNRILKPGGRVVLLTGSHLLEDLKQNVANIQLENSPSSAHRADKSAANGHEYKSKEHASGPLPPTDSLAQGNMEITDEINTELSNGKAVQKDKVTETSEQAKMEDDSSKDHHQGKIKPDGKDLLTCHCAWQIKRAHYLKLGETDAHVCLFHKVEKRWKK